MSEYITTEELIDLGCMPREYIESIDNAEPGFIAAQIRASSSFADTYLNKRHKTPFVTVPDALKQCVADMAVHRIYLKRGYDPSSTQDTTIIALKDEAVALLNKASLGEVEFGGEYDQTPNLDEHGPLAGNSGNNPYAWLKNGYSKYGKHNKYPYGGCCGC